MQWVGCELAIVPADITIGMQVEKANGVSFTII